MYCEKLQNIQDSFEHNKPNDQSSLETVATLVYASYKVGIKELVTIKDIFAGIYGKEFILGSMNNSNLLVSPKLISKLEIPRIDPILIKEYLKGIAQTFGVSNPAVSELFLNDGNTSDDEGGDGSKVNNETGSLIDLTSDLPSVSQLATPKLNIQPTSPSPTAPETDTLSKMLKPPVSDYRDDEQKSIDNLMKRFEALKKS
ncbi:hypothetical protein AYI68_g3604 [Smittium mucronatum]|uniref:IST1-like protein n=1 Tax=Smittium mucronatum TaxID=133383 RepID=A0A1R0GZM3_9FUNG|nr:hypothetical protein AYI68_g3604 [Smittium mucronatum]